MNQDEARIARFIDFENLAIGVWEAFSGQTFNIPALSDALAERGRVILRRAYADWSMFSNDSHGLSRHHVELIDIPQRKDLIRKNGDDIKIPTANSTVRC